MEILVKVIAMVGDKVIVSNYRRGGIPEFGTVRTVGVGIRKDASYHVSYYVELDRRSSGRSRMYRDGGGPLFLTVGDDQIEKD